MLKIVPKNTPINFSLSSDIGNESGSFIATVTPVKPHYIPSDGLNIHYELSGTGITTNDVTSGILTGNVLLTSNGIGKTFGRTLTEDAFLEGKENMVISLFSDSGFANKIASRTIIIDDTSNTFSLLLVGGGGAGGSGESAAGGGGGGGDVRILASQSGSFGDSYTITIGAGGTVGVGTTGHDGGDTTVVYGVGSALTAYGGGGGGFFHGNAKTVYQSGTYKQVGHGGGGGSGSQGTQSIGGGVGIDTLSGLSVYDGGSGQQFSTLTYLVVGGGGAGFAGVGSDSHGVDYGGGGADGYELASFYPNISGYVGGGGGGGANESTNFANGGNGNVNGGRGAIAAVEAQNGVDNTGQGGGGGFNVYSGGSGGSGVVYMVYKTDHGSPRITYTSSGISTIAITNAGITTYIHKFTSDGSIRFLY